MIRLHLFTTRNCVYQTAYHVVWCPKYRRPVLTGTTAETAREILTGICLEKQWPVTALEIQPDHIHLFFGIPPAISISSAVKILKGVSANKLLRLFPHLKTMLRDGHLLVPVVLRRHRRRGGRGDDKTVHRAMRTHSRQEMSLENS